MKNILVSGASGIVGYGILKSLRMSGLSLKLIGTTIYDDSVAQGFCDIFEQAPLTSDPRYIPWLTGVIERHTIDLLIPGIEADMYKWIEHIPELQQTGARVCLNDLTLTALCKDKWKFYETLRAYGSAHAIESSLSADFGELAAAFGLPFLLKPRRGYGSKGIVIVKDETSFLPHAGAMGESLMAQPIVGTEQEEFTTSAFCDGRGGIFCYMTLRRKLSKDGFTERAEVADPDGIREAIGELCKAYHPFGPTNFQFRRHDGVWKLLEINPRISSSTSIRSSFGYNESAMAVVFFLDKKEPVQPTIRPGKAVRYVEDFIFYA